MNRITSMVPKWMRDHNMCVTCNDHHPLTGANGYMSAYVSIFSGKYNLTEQETMKIFKEKGWTFLEKRMKEWLPKLLFTKKR